jgi:hypothetical protein
MRTRYQPEPEGIGVALVIHLSIYSLVFALFSIWLYSLLQPKQIPNPGVVVYEPPAGTVISYDVPARLRSQQGQAPALAELLPAPDADETTGRSAGTVERAAAPERVGKGRERAVKARTSKPPKLAAPPRERGNPWGAYAASYPDYSAHRPF